MLTISRTIKRTSAGSERNGSRRTIDGPAALGLNHAAVGVR